MTDTMREKLDILVLVLSTLLAIVSAMSMRDHVRVVEILGLFASGIGTGAGIAAFVARRRLQAGRSAA
jgi:hypothetical protein